MTLGPGLFALALLASPPDPPHETRDPALLSLPVLDDPDLRGAYAVPTWEQAIEASKAQYQATHRILGRWADRRFGPANRDRAMLTVGLAWEIVANALPLGTSWAHEEGHRAVLDRYGMRSFNGVYDFDPTQGAIYVRRVRDEDLVRLKAEHPADSARLAAAGMETQSVLSHRLERDLFFFRGRPSSDWATLVTNATGNIGYLWVCSDPAFDGFTDEANARDGGVIVRRDALGLDCTAWAHDLVQRDEPYEARGTHPSGRGIDRYLKFSDLSPREQKLLRTVRWMSLASLVDPYLFLEDGWGPISRRATAMLSFYLTSFGWTVDQDLFVHRDGKNLMLTLHHQANGARWMPGLDARLFRLELATDGRPWFLTLGGGVWLQPEDQRWDTARAVPGGRVDASLAIPIARSWEVELAGGYKTAGWVAGVAALDAGTTLRAGVSWKME